VTLRQDMLRVARQAPDTLAPAAALVRAFLAGQRHPEGGYLNRDGQPDLYYSVFGLTAALALDPSPNPAPDRLPPGFLDPSPNISLVNLASLARCLALTQHPDPVLREALRARLDQFCSADDGFAAKPAAARGTIYGAFLALGAAEDLASDANAAAPFVRARRASLAHAVCSLELPDGSFANDHSVGVATVPSTAAAVAILHRLDAPIPNAAQTATWLLAQTLTVGTAIGWTAAPGVPVPDLLSTAVALDALARLNVSLPENLPAGIAEFVDSLWSSDGARAGFTATWADETLDVEYTCYGLVTLGLLRHLSQPAPAGAGRGGAP
jgi:prenyltransferase beta subunit